MKSPPTFCTQLSLLVTISMVWQIYFNTADAQKHVLDDGLDWITTDPKSWYTDSDYCLLQKWHDGGNLDTYMELIAKCKGPTDTSTGATPLGVGLVWKLPEGALCPPENRPYFKKSLSGFRDADSVRLATAFSKIVDSRKCLLFAGDSVTRQSYFAFLAELTRIDKKIKFIRYLHGSDLTPGTFPSTFKNEYEWTGDEQDRYGGLSTVFFNSEVVSHTKTATVWYFHLPESKQVEKAKKLVAELYRAGCNGIVTISNAGLHLNEQKEGRDHFRKILTFLGDLAKDEKNTVIWRETSAQHFPSTPYGMYDLTQKEKITHCKPHQVAGEDWRVTQVKEVWKELKIKDITYIPFYKATLPLYNMHPDAFHSANKSVDCTHYCTWPMLWQPIWQGLADAVL
jgi:hypothetical protein